MLINFTVCTFYFFLFSARFFRTSPHTCVSVPFEMRTWVSVLLGGKVGEGECSLLTYMRNTDCNMPSLQHSFSLPRAFNPSKPVTYKPANSFVPLLQPAHLYPAIRIDTPSTKTLLSRDIEICHSVHHLPHSSDDLYLCVVLLFTSL